MQEKVKRKKYEDHLASPKKAERHLNKMVEEGLIERKGSGPVLIMRLSRHNCDTLVAIELEDY